MPTDIDIARQAKMKPVATIANERFNLPTSALYPIGHYKAKLPLDLLTTRADAPDGKLILVTAITPTPAGEGKTTTSVGLTDALNVIGKNAAVALREPSLGPVFGMKGGAAGGGYAQVVPMEDINLHFTGDFGAISLAHNLLSAVVDNHLHHGNAKRLDSRRIAWRRVVDMNDRALRQIVVGLGGPGNGFSRGDGFDIVVASEVMAILCLSNSLADLKQRISQITVGYDNEQNRVTAGDLGVAGAMTALLKDALQPNLVQTLENNPAFIHGGPFANIAHGCNSVLATRMALKMADYVVTEAGFGADLGAEKFVDIKCRKSGLKANAAVLVATIRAVKFHGGVAREDLGTTNTDAVRAGFENVRRHLRNIREHYGLPVVIALNHFSQDSDEEVQTMKELCSAENADMVLCRHWAEGGRGATELAEKVVALCDANEESSMKFLYADDADLKQKTEAVCEKIYGASVVNTTPAVKKSIETWQKDFGHFPICIAKTQYAFTNEPSDRGIPQDGHRFFISEARLNTGAEFIVLLGGNIMTMPGLPKHPAAMDIDIDGDGNISGLF
ncbi:MAG: formate--tetrahydrofolate ligase [Proteobacteria bacterium]|nr:formate--tetrahydrofolate ligase [Pseudomonadota bacterium]